MPKFLVVPSLVEPDLVLPIEGRDGKVREYTIKAATAEQWITLQAINMSERGMTVNGQDLARLESIEDLDSLHAQTMGADVVKAMLSDGISALDFRRATQTAFQWHVTGGDEDAAEAVWSGKALNPASSTPVTGSTPSGEAGDVVDSTSEPVSTPDTSTPRATKSGSKGRSTAGRTSGTPST